ncbi:MAG: hypothetical protein Q9M19_04775 [Mariprofundaceae bacterium]|nr:hypothetical protein [Mariprofundaceae bacterium]
MKVFQATTTGAMAGACLAFSVCMFNDLALADALFRILVLAMGGAWIGFLMAWLNTILPSSDMHQEHHL